MSCYVCSDEDVLRELAFGPTVSYEDFSWLSVRGNLKSIDSSNRRQLCAFAGTLAYLIVSRHRRATRS